jgi:predicted PurR-regulated permease PerM
MDPSDNSSGPKIAILFGAVVALIGATLYQFYELRQVRGELDSTRDAVMDQISKLHETTTVSSKTNRQSVDSLKTQMDEARRQASILAGQAKVDASKPTNWPPSWRRLSRKKPLKWPNHSPQCRAK